MKFRRRTGGVEVRVDRTEARVLSRVVGDLLELLGEEVDADTDPLAAMVGLPAGDLAPPTDPALARLLPDAYRPDAEGVQDTAAASAEFRRYTEADLRAGKRASAGTVLAGLASVADGGRLQLEREQADAWLSCLNDLRLVLGTRLEVTEELELDRLARDDPRLPALHVYGWLGWVQESLLASLLPRGR